MKREVSKLSKKSYLTKIIPTVQGIRYKVARSDQQAMESGFPLRKSIFWRGSYVQESFDFTIVDYVFELLFSDLEVLLYEFNSLDG